MAVSLTDYLASRPSAANNWKVLFGYVLDNKRHSDGRPMLANNISVDNANRMVGL